jgi:ssDNA-binding Zn-finger/Zn-ribbon topoisomerase 1
MSKGSNRRQEDTKSVNANWDKIDWGEKVPFDICPECGEQMAVWGGGTTHWYACVNPQCKENYEDN